jgi:DNA-binding NarL/FixJ family response regulator
LAKRNVASELRARLAAMIPDAPSEIFLINDDDDSRFLIAHYLRRFFPGAQISEFRDAESALVTLEQRHPNAIITDYILPQMRGVELAKIVRARFPQMPIVMLSGFDPIASEALAAGVNMFIPTSGIAELGNALRKLLESAGQQGGPGPRARTHLR